jgi:hypothetical protein
MNRPIKSLGAFTPRVDPTLRARLATGNKPEASGFQATEPVKPNGATLSPRGVQPQAPKFTQKKEIPDTGPPLTIKIEFYVELINNPQKCCPAFAYLGRKDPPDTLRIVAVLNRGLWPTAAALVRDDGNALRWLVALAITDRCLTWPTHPILRATSRYLCQAAMGERAQDYQAGLWAAYGLKDHPLFAIEKLSILKGKSEHSPEKFTEFNVAVDSARLESWRTKFGAPNTKRSTRS